MWVKHKASDLKVLMTSDGGRLWKPGGFLSSTPGSVDETDLKIKQCDSHNVPEVSRRLRQEPTGGSASRGSGGGPIQLHLLWLSLEFIHCYTAGLRRK